MRARALTRWQKASALVPMAVLVGAWGAALTNSGLATASDGSATTVIPEVPATAFDDPASIQPSPGGIDQRAGAAGTIATLSSSGIPAAALTAYRRAESLLAEADASCHLPWSLLAAIGRVESNHGRSGGNTLDASGISRPGVYGVLLDGRDGRTKVADTDAGAIDKTTVYDRAVGPMQFIPATWRSVGIDADNDGDKNPQSINDAATAAGIYLCAGTDDLATSHGQQAALLRYNHSTSYGDLVLEISARYAAGEFTQAPTGSPESVVLTSRSHDQTLSEGQRDEARDEQRDAETKPGGSADGIPSDNGANPGDNGSGDGGTGTDPGTDPGSGGPTGGGATTKGGGISDLVGGVIDPITGGGGSGGTPSDDPTAPSGPIENTLTWTQAKLQCVADGVSVLNLLAITGCITSLLS